MIADKLLLSLGGPGNGALPSATTLRRGPRMTAFAVEAVVEMVSQAGAGGRDAAGSGSCWGKPVHRARGLAVFSDFRGETGL